ncbi:Myelin-associated oligodendrocyte basic protein isoform 1 [Rhynchospora pubera]|uniref:Myelin-associated oligodendrocyte basic protein isoform 1 n=1 Tax=Rhynchospora pubera TaxID=906938 RepID=A0AAV8FHU2_9POAL|nr:Myelin-associated oligodendrocyte basic protein isoform 1 [Rhynchospora pubera]
MAVSSSPQPLATKSMALALILVLIASFTYDAAAASGGAMGGGFSSSETSSRSSSSHGDSSHSTRSTTYVYRDSCCGYSRNRTPVPQNEMQGRDEDAAMLNFIITVFVIGMMVLIVLKFYKTDLRSKPSVVKLQVALNGACSLQQDLNNIARKANNSTQEGYKYVLEESAKALLRYSEFWLSSHLLERTAYDEKRAESIFYDISFEERCKFDAETLINIDNHKDEKNTWVVVSSSTSPNPFIVVNVIVATAGPLKLSPIISTATDLRAILKKLGGLAKSEILAAHVLWTPQDENDRLSAERVFQDYPLLRKLILL